MTSSTSPSCAGSGSSEFWLPSFAFNLEVMPDVVARAAYSRSISRPPIGALGPNRSFDGAPNIGSKSVSSGNPDLQPFVSDNFDLALEWYYAPGSFASVGFFNKLVDNFLISTTEERTFEGLRDPFLGPLAEQAREELAAEGMTPGQRGRVPPDESDPRRRSDPIRQSPDDPLAQFRVTTTTNAEEGDLYGFEFAVQHLFGESGWGVQANATLVEGDVDADVNVVDQSFALPGLSDTANIIVFYETERFRPHRLELARRVPERFRSVRRPGVHRVVRADRYQPDLQRQRKLLGLRRRVEHQ